MTTISRRELFDKVWAQPVTKVAAEFGLSDNGLRKICGRHDIPIPSRGYWAQVQAGRSFPRPKLRPVRHPSLEEVTFVGAPPVPPEVAAALTEAKERLAAAAAPKPANQEAVAELPQPPSAENAAGAPQSPDADIVAEHSELLPTRKALLRGKPDRKGFIRAQGRGVLPVVVGPASVERALAWLSQFLRFAEAQGERFHRKEEGAVLIVDKQEIPFRIEEKSEPTPHAPTAAELTERSRLAHVYSATWTPWPKYDHSPSGRLALIIEGAGVSGLRKTFGETAKQTLDQMNGDILSAFIVRAAFIKENRRKAEIARREAEAAHQRRERRKAFEQREERREKFVALIADKLQERARLSAVLAHAEQQSGEDHQRFDAMVGWIRRRLAELNALVSPTFLDISARFAKIDFDEARAASAPPEPSWHYPRAVELQLWMIDEEKNEARSQSAFEWARDQGLVPDVERDGHEQGCDEPDQS